MASRANLRSSVSPEATGAVVIFMAAVYRRSDNLLNTSDSLTPPRKYNRRLTSGGTRMVRYGAANGSLAAPPITGAIVAPQSGSPSAFYAWEPSTWPQPPKKVDDGFIENLRIFDDSMLGEKQKYQCAEVEMEKRTFD